MKEPDSSDISITDLIKRNIDLKAYSRWKIGGKADYFSEPKNHIQLLKTLEYAKLNSLPYQILGDATNILFDDDGYRGIIIRIGHNLNRCEIKESKIFVEAGHWIPCLAKKTADHHLSGLEHTVGIPGTLGGLIYMNGGSNRNSISSNILAVHAIDENLNEVILTNSECGFSYRKSIFQRNKYIIIKALLQLQHKSKAVIREEMLSILANRKKKFPLKEPNCGSVFTRNTELYNKFGPPGKIIEDLGLKGYRIGGAVVSNVHANFIVNDGNATAREVVQLVKKINTLIFSKTNKLLKSEIRYLSPQGTFKFMHEL